jgi:hypothetical protein
MSKNFRHSLIAIACLLASGCFWETTDASYSTAKEVIDSGFLEKGWIPRWLPPDATDLRETHNIDSNVSELSFSIPSRASLELPASCTPATFNDTVPAYIQRRWWPTEQELRDSYIFFRCTADVTDYTFVGVNKSGQRVIHWRTYAR